ncbi:hypothetical protein KAW80_01495 [Candidatus Babeliales bacterium]|nr:hypothetical protein [Candidatus Babeliales bacterium]
MFLKLKTFLILLPCFVFGIFFFLIHQEWIIFNFKNNNSLDQNANYSVSRKNVKIYYWREGKFFSDTISIIWKNDLVEDLKHLINVWLGVVYEEQLTERKSSLEFVSITQGQQEVHLSFDSSIIQPEWPIFKKWNFLESLLKTVRESSVDVKFLVFLIRHKIMKDAHLDFSKPWSIDGFICEE